MRPPLRWMASPTGNCKHLCLARNGGTLSEGVCGSWGLVRNPGNALAKCKNCLRKEKGMKL